MGRSLKRPAQTADRVQRTRPAPRPKATAPPRPRPPPVPPRRQPPDPRWVRTSPLPVCRLWLPPPKLPRRGAMRGSGLLSMAPDNPKREAMRLRRPRDRRRRTGRQEHEWLPRPPNPARFQAAKTRRRPRMAVRVPRPPPSSARRRRPPRAWLCSNQHPSKPPCRQTKTAMTRTATTPKRSSRRRQQRTSRNRRRRGRRSPLKSSRCGPPKPARSSTWRRA